MKVSERLPQGLKNQFASDNYAGICPEAWKAMKDVSAGYANSYGDDLYTARACNLLRDFFETDCQVFFVFNGTAANSLALASLCQSYHSIICPESAHIETDECGAVEFFSNGTKVLLVPSREGKIDLEAAEHAIIRRTDIHYPKPKVLSITQSTELGTVYSVDELQAVGALARKYDMKLHVDGARFANAVASLQVAPREISWQAGVDVLTFGGTKNGLAVGEAVIFFDARLAREFDYRCKQAGQLASKMRFLSAPWSGMLSDGALLRHAAHANDCARRVAAGLGSIAGLEVVYPCQANAVFVGMPEPLIEALRQRGWHFYTFIGTGLARFMCSWSTHQADIDALVSDTRELVAAL